MDKRKPITKTSNNLETTLPSLPKINQTIIDTQNPEIFDFNNIIENSPLKYISTILYKAKNTLNQIIQQIINFKT